MARSSIDLERAGLRTPRERMWAAMLKLAAKGEGRFQALDVSDLAHLPGAPIRVSAVHDYLQGLIAAGYAEMLTTPTTMRFVPLHFRLLRRTGPAPCVDADGRPTTPAIGITAMWRAMKIRRVFDHAEIAADATQGEHVCTEATASAYVRQLAYAGYLRVERASKPGTKARYALVRDTGPLAPAITRARVVFDRNTGALMPCETAQQVCDALAARGEA